MLKYLHMPKKRTIFAVWLLKRTPIVAPKIRKYEDKLSYYQVVPEGK